MLDGFFEIIPFIYQALCLDPLLLEDSSELKKTEKKNSHLQQFSYSARSGKTGCNMLIKEHLLISKR